MIEPASKIGDHVRVGQRLTRHPVFGKFAAPGVAEATGLDLLAQHGRRDATLWITGSWIGKPSDAVTLIQEHSKTLDGIVALSEGRPALLVVCPTDVTRTLSVAGLAADAYFCPCGGKSIVGCIIIFLHAGRVALGTHEIPVLVQLCPVQDIIVLDLLVGIEVKPALAALVFWAAIPGN